VNIWQLTAVQNNNYERYVMKKTLVLLLMGALLTVTPASAHAGDKEWAAVGKILTGVAAVAIVGDVIYQQSAPCPPIVTHRPKLVTIQAPPPVVYRPPTPRVVVRHRPRFSRQRAVIVERPRVVIEQPRVRYRERPHRHRRVVSPPVVACPTRY